MLFKKIYYISFLFLIFSISSLIFKYSFLNNYNSNDITDIFISAFFNNKPIKLHIILLLIISVLISIAILSILKRLYKNLINQTIYIDFNGVNQRKQIVINNIYEKVLIFITIALLIFTYNYKISTTILITKSIKYLSINAELLTNDNKINDAPIFPLVAHACGGIGERTYTNSMDALKLNYYLGHKLFEVDLLLLPDHEIICAHDINNLNKITNTTEPIIKSNEYKSKKIYGIYTLMDLKDLLRFMSQHKDMYLVTDSKNAQASIGFINDDKYNEIFWESFITIAKNIDRSILERVIPQIYYPKMLTIINKYYKFKRYIFTLYATNMNDDAVLKFVYENPSIYYITMPPNRVNNYDFIEKLLQLKRKTFIHTINNIDEMIFYRKKGIFGFYTDFIIPSQIKDVL